jgi:hypothetical protein
MAGVGAGNALVTLGVCQDGATVEIQPAAHGIKSDGGGGPEGNEVEWIQLNAVAIIRFKLVPYAGVYINALRAAAVASGSEGVLPIPGTLFGANGFLPALYLPTLDGDGPWYFPTTRVVRPGGNQVSTKETTPDWEFRALINFDPTTNVSVAGLPLYTRAAP